MGSQESIQTMAWRGNDHHLIFKWELTLTCLDLSLTSPGCHLLNAAPQLVFSVFPPYFHVYTRIFRSVIHTEENIGYCLALLLWTETGWLWYYQHCWMYCMHHRALAAYFVQHAGIGLSSFQPRFCQAVLITKSLATLSKHISESFRNTVSQFRVGLWDEVNRCCFSCCLHCVHLWASQQFACWTSAVQLLHYSRTR